MPVHARRRSPSLPFALALSLGPVACGRGPAEPQPLPPGGDAAPQAEVEAPPAATDACRNWSDLDVASLPELPATPYTATLEQVWRIVLEKHYDPTLGCLDWPAMRVEYGAKLSEAKDDAAAFAIMAQMLGRLGQSHLAVVPPRERMAGEPRAAVKSGDARVPIEVRVLGGEAIVVRNALEGSKSGIPQGAALLAIDDEELAPMIASMKESHTREVEATFAARRVVASMLTCPSGTSKTLRFEVAGAKASKTKKVACQTVKAERVSLGNLKDIPAVVEHRMLPKTKVGYVSFNIWMLPLVPKLEEAIAELRGQGMKALVIDLRGNPGGVGAMVVPLGRQLLSQAVDLGAMHMREGEQVFNVAAGTDPFTGPLAILIDEGTASTSEIFAQALQDLGRAKVYGAVPSQGAALPSVIEELAGGGMIQYVVADYVSPKGQIVEGKGVTPDTVVPETREDFAKGRDPVLDTAVAALHGG